MNGITQTILASPDLEAVGVFGNCLQAAVATLLEKPLDAVPHFSAYVSWPQALHLWAYDQGLVSMYSPATVIPEWRCIVGGRSPRGIRHVVIGENGRIVWDPHPSRTGLETITELFWFEPLVDRPEDRHAVFIPFGGYLAAEALRHHGYTVTEPPSTDE